MKALTISLFSLICSSLFAQKVTLDPSIEPRFFDKDDEITITYDVSGTSLQDLDEAWIWMWLPDVADHSVPSNVNPANSNTSSTNAAKFTKSTTSNGRFLFSITLVLSDFISTNEDFDKVGMLIKGNDWSDGQSTDFIANLSSGFTVIFENPSSKFGFFDGPQDITINALASESSTIELFVDDQIVASASNATELNFTHSIIDDGSVHTINAKASTDTESAETTYAYTLTPTPTTEARPTGTVDGINYTSSSTATLSLAAPNKEHVFVIGDFNNWSIDSDYLMKRDEDHFWLQVDGLESGKEYQFQYLVDGEIRIADPYAEKIASQFDDGEIISEGRYANLMPYPSSETSEAVSYLQTDQQTFDWVAFERPEKEDMIIYELLIRDFTEERTYEAVTNRLDYLADLGVNALELMPVQEFEGNLSWGYNPSSMLAVDKYYGEELDLKTLINEAHKRGIAVILDIVLNHQFGRNSLVRLYNEGTYGAPTAENPWFNTTAKHDFNVGYDMNHESQYTKDYTDRVVKYWLEEYNIDGYRFDLSKGFTQKNTIGNVGLWGQYDASRIAIWKRIADVIWDQDPTAYIILEHFADNDEEKELSEYGMMLWGNMNHTYIKAAKGSSTSLSDLYHEGRGWTDPHLIGYMESHDEERLMWEVLKSETENAALERAKLATAFFLTVPGPKMIWQFGEMGYDEELNNDRLGIKPTHWEYLDDPKRKKLFDLYKSLINLRTKTNYINEAYFSWNTSPFVKTININHPEVSIYLIGNFDDDTQTTTHNFPNAGIWYDYFTGESFEITDPSAEVTLGSGSWHMFTSKLIDNYIDDQEITLSNKAPEHYVIYPNPTHDFIRVNNNWRNGSYLITDQTGRVVNSGDINGEAINLTDLNPGIYFLTLKKAARKISETILVK